MEVESTPRGARLNAMSQLQEEVNEGMKGTSFTGIQKPSKTSKSINKADRPKKLSRRQLRKPKKNRNHYERMYKREKFIKVILTCFFQVSMPSPTKRLWPHLFLISLWTFSVIFWIQSVKVSFGISLQTLYREETMSDMNCLYILKILVYTRCQRGNEMWLRFEN